jgi:putative ABC transport system permease protein
MLLNDLQSASRNLNINKRFSFINKLVLILGIASATLILIWMEKELTYDHFHKNRNFLYQVWNRAEVNGKWECWKLTPKILGPRLKQDFPEIAEMARANPRLLQISAAGEKRYTKALFTDPSFLKMFSFPLLKGDPARALNQVNSVVITEKMARSMFGQQEAIHQVIRIGQDPFTVTGILKELPQKSSLDFECLVPWAYLKELGQDDSDWGNNSVDTYVQLRPGASEVRADELIKNTTSIYSNGEEGQDIFLHPLLKWHLYSEFENGRISGGRIELVRLFGIIAACILLVGCIHFISLSNARHKKRSEATVIRKSIGGDRPIQARYFL